MQGAGVTDPGDAAALARAAHELASVDVEALLAPFDDAGAAAVLCAFVADAHQILLALHQHAHPAPSSEVARLGGGLLRNATACAGGQAAPSGQRIAEQLSAWAVQQRTAAACAVAAARLWPVWLAACRRLGPAAVARAFAL